MPSLILDMFRQIILRQQRKLELDVSSRRFHNVGCIRNKYHTDNLSW